MVRYVQICVVDERLSRDKETIISEKLFTDLGAGNKNLLYVYKAKDDFQMKDLSLSKAEKIIPTQQEEAEKLRRYLES